MFGYATVWMGLSHSLATTLTGGNFNDEGLDPEKLTRNLNAACDIYIDRIQGAPCMKTQLNAVRGCKDQHALDLQARRPDLITFLKGSRQAKEQLKGENLTW